MISNVALKLPLETFFSIVEEVEDTKSLMALSLTCRSLFPLCRKQIFSAVSIYQTSSESYNFSSVLTTSPDVAQYVKQASFMISEIDNIDKQLHILDALRNNSRMHSFHLYSSQNSYWSDIPESLRSSILALLQLPTITYLHVHYIVNFPATVLVNCCNLRRLRFNDLCLVPIDLRFLLMDRQYDDLLTDSDMPLVKSSNKIPTLIELDVHTCCAEVLNMLLQNTESGLMVDFSHLQIAVFKAASHSPSMPPRYEDFPTYKKVLSMTTRLQSLDLDIESPLSLDGLVESLNPASCSTLKSITFRLSGEYVEDDPDYRPIPALTNEFRIFSGNNILEEIKVSIQEPSFVTFNDRLEDWSNFDEVLTDPGFPHLRRVVIKVHIRYNPPDVLLLEEMLSEQLEQLSESSTVALEFTGSKELSGTLKDEEKMLSRFPWMIN